MTQKPIKHFMHILLPLVASIYTLSCTKDLNHENEPEDFSFLTIYNMSELNDNKISIVTNLTIRGNIQGSDWNILYRVAHNGKLKTLDLSDAVILRDHDNQDIWKNNEIPEYTFEGSKTLEEVKLPNNLKSIGKEAFANCRNLKKIKFGNAIDSIADRAFYNSGIIGEFQIPNSLSVVGRQAFAQTSVSKVCINSDVRVVKSEKVYAIYGNSVFANCSELTEVSVSDGCSVLELGFEHCQNLTNVRLPSTLKQIGHDSSSTANYIFKNCSSLNNIKLPENLWFIGHSAFSRTPIETIEIPNSVQYIWKYAFLDCAHLKNVKMSNSLQKLEQSCFEGCQTLHSIQLPNTLTEIGYSSFKDCTSLSNVVLAENICSIGRNAFLNCSSLISIELPCKLVLLGESSFEGCSSLSSVIINNKLTTLETSTFKNCTKLNSVIMGNQISKIGSNCFYGCLSLCQIELPISINSFSDYSFAYSGLKELKVHWITPIQISENVFTGMNRGNMRLKVPLGTKQAYCASNVWCEFGDIVEFNGISGPE